MKIAFTSDLHVDATPRNRELLPYLMEELCTIGADVFIICGDISPVAEDIEHVLGLFSALDCRKIFVAGNHDIWLSRPEMRSSNQIDSFVKYSEVLPGICERHGFICLHREGFVYGNLGFAGAMGWYDFSLRNADLDGEISMDEYSRGRFRNLRWNDLVYASWKTLPHREEGGRLSQAGITRWMWQALRNQLEALERPGIEKVCVVTHFLPIKGIIRYSNDPAWDFSCAYLGSEMLGRLMEEFPGISLWLCGHIHRKSSAEFGSARIMCSPVGYLHFQGEDLRATARAGISVIDFQE